MYRVIVGNIGTVYSGDSQKTALQTFKEYKQQSKTDYGRAAGESVVVMCHDEVVREYVGKLERMER